MAYFDHFATGTGTALGDLLTARTVDAEYEFLRGHLRSGTDLEILEIGPGQGELASRFLQNGYKCYDVVEPNAAMREKLQAMGVRSARNYMIPPIEEGDAAYDLIIVCDVFEHLNGAPEAQRFVADAARVLRPGGLLFILSPDYLDWKEDFFNCDFSHSNPTTVRRTTQIFFNAGLETVDRRYGYSCFHGPIGFLLSRLVKLLTCWTPGERSEFKPYKLRLTFLRRFLVLGRKPGGRRPDSPVKGDSRTRSNA